MKVILAGVTGFIGGEVLEQCLQNSTITSVLVLSRRELPPSLTSNPKLAVKIIDDFLSYPESLVQDLQGAEACIWTLGKAHMSDLDLYRKISIDYTVAALKAFDQNLAPTGKKFRFVYCSGAYTSRDQTQSLLFAQDLRQIRGQVENQLLAYGNDHENTMETYIARPAFVLSKQATLAKCITWLGQSIQVDVLARVMVNVALNGSQDQILENSAMNKGNVKGPTS